MELVISKELEDILNKHVEIYNMFSENIKARAKQVHQDFGYLIGKQVKFSNKGWNVGTITQIFSKGGFSYESNFYLNFEVIGPNKEKVLVGMEEAILLD